MTTSGIEVWCVGKAGFGGLTPAGVSQKVAQIFWESPLFPLVLVVLICFLAMRLESQSKSDKQSGRFDRIDAVTPNKKPAPAKVLAQAAVNID